MDKIHPETKHLHYISYLKRNFENKVYPDNGMGDISAVVPGKNCYHDILFRMSLNLTREKMQKNLLMINRYAMIEEYMQLMEQLKVSDSVVENARRKFEEELYWLDESSYEQKVGEINNSAMGLLVEKFKGKLGLSDEVFKNNVDVQYDETKNIVKIDVRDWSGDTNSETQNLLRLLEINRILMNDVELDDLESVYYEVKPEWGSETPIDWFGEEEIRMFIEEHFGPAETEEEKKIDALLRRVNELCPETIDYYVFPKEWEENGLAELVRSNYGIVLNNKAL